MQGGGGRGKTGSGFESRQACFFFSRLSFRNYLSGVFNCDDLQASFTVGEIFMR